LTAQQDFLRHPNGLVVRADTLIFWVENQGACYWGVPCESLKEDDPSVVITEAGSTGWEVESKLNWKPSHPHLSSFLDDMTYQHAFLGGAIHGGWAPSNLLSTLPADQVAWLEEHWSKANVGPMVFGVEPNANWHCPPVYTRDGQAFWWGTLASREAQAVDEIGKRLQFTWKWRW
jgi:hypothetical protein